MELSEKAERDIETTVRCLLEQGVTPSIIAAAVARIASFHLVYGPDYDDWPCRPAYRH